jgi:hypothetical protein
MNFENGRPFGTTRPRSGLNVSASEHINKGLTINQADVFNIDLFHAFLEQRMKCRNGIVTNPKRVLKMGFKFGTIEN